MGRYESITQESITHESSNKHLKFTFFSNISLDQILTIYSKKLIHTIVHIHSHSNVHFGISVCGSDDSGYRYLDVIDPHNISDMVTQQIIL